LGEVIVIAALRSLTDRVLGRGSAAITVPPFDGALKPNQVLSTPRWSLSSPRPTTLRAMAARSFADGAAVLRHREGAAPDLVRRFDREVTALCALPDGGWRRRWTAARFASSPPRRRAGRRCD